jgi:hypothetical protein
MGKAENYRARAAAVIKAAKKRTGFGRRSEMTKKAKALLDMADNQDWLDGKPTRKKPPTP